MKSPLYDAMCEKLAKQTLDFVECLPKFQRGIIADLQVHREFQRKHSSELYETTRPPEGASLEYLYFRLVEIFTIENFEELYSGLKQLFPEADTDLSANIFFKDPQGFASSLSSGGWSKLGILVPESRKITFHPFPHRTISSLPTEVEQVDLTLHKLLPSVLILTLDVMLNTKASKDLADIQSRHYLPKVRYKGIIPWSRRTRGYHEWPTEKAMRDEVESWHERLREALESCVRPYIKGHFMRRSPTDRPLLPAIEVYALKGIPDEVETFAVWKTAARKWLRSYGLIFDYDAYSNEKLIYRQYKDASVSTITPQFLIVLWEPYLRLTRTEGFGTPRQAVEYYTGETLDAITAGTAILHYLKSIQDDIQTLRNHAFNSIKRPLRRRRGLKQDLNLSMGIQQLSLQLDRLAVEHGQHERSFLGNMVESAQLRDIGRVECADSERTLRDTIISSVKWQLDQLKQHLTVVQKSFLEHLSIRNMEAMYYLQRSMFVLAIIASLATVLGLISQKQAIYDFILIYLNSILSR